MQNITAFLCGLVFSVGLVVGGMTLPSNVVGFLDFFGDWNPSLMFVMAGAVSVYLVLFRLIRGKKQNTASRFPVWNHTMVDRPLILGAVFFGVGWGLAGYCPGPALTSLGAGSVDAIAFVLAMCLGMLLYHWMEKTNQRSSKSSMS